MSDQNMSAFDDQNEPASGGSPKLPGGISVQAAATGLLIIVFVAILWLFFGPSPDSDTPADLPTATAGANGAGTSTAQAPLGTAGTPGAPVAGSPVATPVIVNATPGAGMIGGATAGAVGTSVTSGTPAAPVSSAPLAVDSFVLVANTDNLGMRMRFGAGLDTASIRSAVPEGEVLRVVGGPETSDGITWWRLQDTQGNIGWASAEFLTSTTAPTSWSPPAASPTFEPDAYQPEPQPTEEP